MAYIGQTPTAVPLDGDDLADNIITSAKIADGAIVNADINASAAIVGTKLTALAGNVAFPATQSASSDANTLDDYEEGTWTPQFSSSGADATMGAATGYYVKIGRLVMINGFCVTTDVSGLAVSSYIQDLPFTCTSDTTASNVVVFTNCGGLAITAGTYITGIIDRNTTDIRLQLWDSAVGTSHLITTSEWTDNGSGYFSGHYFV